jgi:hypothetical protein
MTPRERKTHDDIYDASHRLIACIPIVYEGKLKMGYSCPPEAVWAILLDSDLFFSEEVEGWTETVFVPLGLISERIVRYAIEDGGLIHRSWFLGPPGSRFASPLYLTDDKEYHRYAGWTRNGKMVKDQVR